MVETKKIKYFHVRGKMKKLARLVGCGSTTSIARYVVNQPDLRKRAIDCVITLMKRELTTLSSDTFSSILRAKSQTAMEFFIWESVWRESVWNCHFMRPHYFRFCTGLLLGDQSILQESCSLCLCNQFIKVEESQNVPHPGNVIFALDL